MTKYLADLYAEHGLRFVFGITAHIGLLMITTVAVISAFQVSLAGGIFVLGAILTFIGWVGFLTNLI